MCVLDPRHLTRSHGRVHGVLRWRRRHHAFIGASQSSGPLL
jgi:hypothetical protein